MPKRAVPLGSRMRLQILRTIGERPGISGPSLRKIFGISKATVTFHLRVLTRHRMVKGMRSGRADHYWVAASCPPDEKAMEVAAAMHHPVKQAICKALAAAQRPISYADLKQEWSRDGTRVPSAKNFLYHARKMQNLGILKSMKFGASRLWMIANLAPLEGTRLHNGILHETSRAAS